MISDYPAKLNFFNFFFTQFNTSFAFCFDNKNNVAFKFSQRSKIGKLFVMQSKELRLIIFF